MKISNLQILYFLVFVACFTYKMIQKRLTIFISVFSVFNRKILQSNTPQTQKLQLKSIPQKTKRYYEVESPLDTLLPKCNKQAAEAAPGIRVKIAKIHFDLRFENGTNWVRSI